MSGPRFALRELEMHVTDACNLACESCAHYANHGHAGRLSIDEAEAWLRPWSGRLEPAIFSLMGGEPALHPDLPAFVGIARRAFPRSALVVVSNGLLLHRHPDLPRVLAVDGNARLDVSLHALDEPYERAFQPVLELLQAWRDTHGVDIKVRRSVDVWTRRYHGFGATMLPFDDGLPRTSWEICPAKFCMQIRDGRLWKCAPLAYLPLQAGKYKLDPAWDPYLAYRPLAPEASDAELARFLAREEEAVCGMCPSARRPFRPRVWRARADGSAPHE